jgi:hypothetical protein
MLTWQEEVLLTDVRYIIARVCRRGGKTRTAVNYAVAEANQRVIFVVPHETQRKLILEIIRETYGSMVILAKEDQVALTNGTTIRILSEAQLKKDSCGLRATKIIVDEAGYVSADLVNILLPCIADHKNAQVFLVSTTYNKGSMMEAITASRPSSALYVSYDYTDMLNEREVTPAQIFELKDQMSLATFAEEFGPYTTFDIDNQMMEHVLRSLDQYV